jgi:hypothetical protein
MKPSFSDPKLMDGKMLGDLKGELAELYGLKKNLTVVEKLAKKELLDGAEAKLDGLTNLTAGIKEEAESKVRQAAERDDGERAGVEEAHPRAHPRVHPSPFFLTSFSSRSLLSLSGHGRQRNGRGENRSVTQCATETERERER